MGCTPLYGKSVRNIVVFLQKVWVFCVAADVGDKSIQGGAEDEGELSGGASGDGVWAMRAWVRN